MFGTLCPCAISDGLNQIILEASVFSLVAQFRRERNQHWMLLLSFYDLGKVIYHVGE
jgi:hypothetical protein